MVAQDVITLPALGQDVQLGMMFDVRTSQLYAGVSLWKNSEVNDLQEVDPQRVQDSCYNFTTSHTDARTHAGLDLAGSLSLDIGLFKATGSAKYLSDEKSSTFEARGDLSCTVQRRTRRIPQEKLSNMPYENHLTNPLFTHFVAEVVEGGSATLSFVQTCKSEEEMKNIEGQLKVKLTNLPVGVSGKVTYKNETESTFKNLRISYSGAMAESVTNIEDALRVIGKLPSELGKQMNSLSFKLLPLSVIDSSVRRHIRDLDTALVSETVAALKENSDARLQIAGLLDQGVLRNTFPTIKQQIENLYIKFEQIETSVKQDIRRLLPELRDGTTDHDANIDELRKVVALLKQRTRYALQFVEKKQREASVLHFTVDDLLREGFENHLSAGPNSTSLVDGGSSRLLLSFCGSGISRTKHPLQKRIESSEITCADTSESSDDDDEDEEEWYEDQHIISRVRTNCTTFRQLHARLKGCDKAAPAVTFGVASIDKAYRPGRPKRSKTKIGEIVLDCAGKLTVVSDMLPVSPDSPTVKVVKQSIYVSWPNQIRIYVDEAHVPTTSFVIRYRPRPNPTLDGAFPNATESEVFKEKRVKFVTASPTDNSNNLYILEDLYDNCDYEVSLCVETTVGPSDWSSPALCRTQKLPSTASRMIDFYLQNSDRLKIPANGSRPWVLSNGPTPTLYLGFNIVGTRFCRDGIFAKELAVRIVDIAHEFMPNTKPHDETDQENTIIILFAGATGHGKSTQINAFAASMFEGDLGDAARVMVIDDRNANQARSVTKYITCYRIRPLSPLFGGKTLIIVDTPGYGDTGDSNTLGYVRDKFVTAAMNEFFKFVKHVNAIVFTCRANESRTTILEPVSTYVFSLFAKNVRRCLRTIYTFSDVGAPLARNALQQLGWPVENGEIEVNNAAFAVGSANNDNPKIRDWWRMSANGQRKVLYMVRRMPPVPTDASVQVSRYRLELEEKCELAEKKILRTANDAQNLIADLGALAKAVGSAPGDKVSVRVTDAVQEPVPHGKHTTLCMTCNYTCHKFCSRSDDKDKELCIAMSNGYCKFCKGRCHWTAHKNAKFIILPVERTEMVVPEDLIKKWNTTTCTLEGALLDAIDAYLKLQEELRNDISYLAELTAELENNALRHNPAGLINYVESLIQTARARGAPAEQLIQLATAKNTLRLAQQVQVSGREGVSRDSRVLVQVLQDVKKEMQFRVNLEGLRRAELEKKTCHLYDKLWSNLPKDIQQKAPKRLHNTLSSLGLREGARYPENLKAIVKLVKVVLTDGGVVAALVQS